MGSFNLRVQSSGSKTLTLVADAGSVTGLSETAVILALVPAIVCISIFSDIFLLNITPERSQIRTIPHSSFDSDTTNVQETTFPTHRQIHN